MSSESNRPMLKVELQEEVRRLRKRTHELADKANQDNACLIRQVGKYQAAFERARETVKSIRADWTTDPPSQADDGFWRYTSENTRVALAFMAARIIELEADRDQWRLRAEAASR